MIPKRLQRQFTIRVERPHQKVEVLHRVCHQLVARERDFNLERITELCEQHLDEGCVARGGESHG